VSYRDALAGLRERVLALLADLARVFEGVSPEVLAKLPDAYRSLRARTERVKDVGAMSFDELSALADDLDELVSGSREALANAERAARSTARRPAAPPR